MRSYSSAVMLCVASNLRSDGGWLGNDGGGGSWSSLMPSLSHRDCRCGGVVGRSAQEKCAALTVEGFACAAACGVWRTARSYAILWKQNPTQAGMAELADAADSKSAGPCGHGGSTPPPGTRVREVENQSFTNYPRPLCPKVCQPCAQVLLTGTKSPAIFFGISRWFSAHMRFKRRLNNMVY